MREMMILLSAVALVAIGCGGSDTDGADNADSPDMGDRSRSDAGNGAEDAAAETEGAADVVAEVEADAEADTLSEGDTLSEADTLPEADLSEPVECSYPEGPYEFRRVGDIVGPMSWPSAIAGADETLEADLEVIRCDPNVHSVFIQIATTWCPSCPSRMREIAGLADHWEANGAKWIFLVTDVSDVADADSYVNRYSIDFGWRSNDADNALGAYTIANSPIFSAQPWTGVIRTSDMELLYDEPDDAYLDIEAIAEALANQ